MIWITSCNWPAEKPMKSYTAVYTYLCLCSQGIQKNHDDDDLIRKFFDLYELSIGRC